MAWYYSSGTNQNGPLSDAEFNQLIQTGAISPDTLIWTETMPDWQPLSVVRPNLAANIQANPAVPTVGGVAVGHQFKDRAVQQMREGGSRNLDQATYAGFWIRFGAVLIDGILLFVVQLIIGVFFGLAFAKSLNEGGHAVDVAGIFVNIISIVGAWLYEALMVSSSTQATLGKMALNLKVVDVNGQRLGFGRATGRHFAKMISSLILAIGYIMAAFDPEKRALHDRIAGTRVIINK